MVVPDENEEECDLCKLIDEEIKKKNFENLKKIKRLIEDGG